MRGRTPLTRGPRLPYDGDVKPDLASQDTPPRQPRGPAACSAPRSRNAAFTLVEVAIGITLITALAVAVLGATLQARRTSEEAIIQNAATSIVYGLVEQMKTLNLSNEVTFNQLPSPADADCGQPHVKVRVDNSTTNGVFLIASTGAPPEVTPAAAVDAATVSAVDNVVGPFDLSQTTGVSVQPLTITLWLWIEPDYQPTAMEPMCRVTLVYTYRINLGNELRTFRDSVRFVRSNRNIPRST